MVLMINFFDWALLSNIESQLVWYEKKTSQGKDNSNKKKNHAGRLTPRQCSLLAQFYLFN